MSYESDSCEKDYTYLIKDGLNHSGNEAGPDDITSHPCSGEDDLEGKPRFFVPDGNDYYEVNLDGSERGELPDSLETLAEANLEDQIESSKFKYIQWDRPLSEDMIRSAAEGAGIPYEKYCKLHNIKLYEKSLSNNDKEKVENISTAEQRANLAKLALEKINAFEIFRFAHMSPDNMMHEEEGLDYVRKAVKLQLDIDGEKQDETTIKAAELLLKAEIMKCFEPGNEAAGNSFLEAQNKIIDDNKEEKKLSINPNFNKKCR